MSYKRYVTKLEKGVAIPDDLFHKDTRYKYPWREMEVGDSFYLKNPPKTFETNMCSVGGHLQKKFKAMRDEKGGIRVWRVE